jgi:putative aldouronate transport system permease protein
MVEKSKKIENEVLIEDPIPEVDKINDGKTKVKHVRRKMILSKSDISFKILNALILGFFCLMIIYPLVYVLSASFSSPSAVTQGDVWLYPVDLSLEGYKAVFKNNEVWTGYANSIFYMVAGTLINVTITLLAAYALAQPGLPGSTFIMMFFTFTLLFSGGIVPLYLVVKATIGVNNRLDMLLPNAMGVANLIITRTFIKMNLPIELKEAAQIEGSDEFTYFTKIALPLSTPIIAVLTMLYALYHWNSFFLAFIFLNSKPLFPLQIVLRNILVANEIAMGSFGDAKYLASMAGMKDLLKFSLIVVSTLPMLILYPFVQRYFIRGIMIGSIKG